jgi:hypothetical protein
MVEHGRHSRDALRLRRATERHDPAEPAHRDGESTGAV